MPEKAPSMQDLLDRAIDALRAFNARATHELVDAEVSDTTLLAGEAVRLADAALVRMAARLDAARVWIDDGARSPTEWIGWRCGLARSRARGVVTRARQLREMPVVEAALATGRISVEHVRLLAHAQQRAPEAFAAEEERLVDQATRVLFSSFERTIRYFVQINAADDAEGDAEALRQQRRVDASRTFEGAVVVDAILDPITGEVFLRELERLEQAEFEADWAEARSRVGDGASAADLPRTPKQRRADALRVMAERSAAKPPHATEPRVLIHVVAGTETMKNVCELSNGQVITPGQLVPILQWADVSRVIFDGPSRVLDVGVRQRLFTAATRIAVERRDQVCQHPSCDIPAERCEIDHIVPFELGGPTTTDNGRALCRFHHRLHHKQRRTQPAA